MPLRSMVQSVTYALQKGAYSYTGPFIGCISGMTTRKSDIRQRHREVPGRRPLRPLAQPTFSYTRSQARTTGSEDTAPNCEKYPGSTPCRTFRVRNPQIHLHPLHLPYEAQPR